MENSIRKIVNINGNDILLDQWDLDFRSRIITLCGEITNGTASQINSMLRCLARDSDEDITIYIMSPGGSVSAGLSIYDTVKSIPCDVCTVACGMAASMGAFLLAAAGTKGKRYAQPNAEILIHQPLGGVQGQASDIRIHAEHILKTRECLNSILADCTGKSVKKIAEDTERDFIMDACEAKEYGIVDHIGDPISDN